MKKLLAASLLVLLGVALTSCCAPCRKAKPVQVKGAKWGLLELNDKVVDRQAGDRTDRLTLVLGEDGRISGKGDCNGFFGTYTLESDKISIGRVASTRMLCPNQALEDQYLRTLEGAVKIKIDGNFLILMDSEGKIVASFRKISD